MNVAQSASESAAPRLSPGSSELCLEDSAAIVVEDESVFPWWVGSVVGAGARSENHRDLRSLI